MSRAERVWLVDRTYSDKGMDVDPDRLRPVGDEERDRFAAEAARIADRHDVEDVV
jgi:hypothetical protein